MPFRPRVVASPKTVDAAIDAGQQSIARNVRVHEEKLRFQIAQANESLGYLSDAIPIAAGNMDHTMLRELLEIHENTRGIRASLELMTETLDALHNATLLPGEGVRS